jgi:hypothetical protein
MVPGGGGRERRFARRNPPDPRIVRRRILACSLQLAASLLGTIQVAAIHAEGGDWWLQFLAAPKNRWPGVFTASCDIRIKIVNLCHFTIVTAVAFTPDGWLWQLQFWRHPRSIECIIHFPQVSKRTDKRAKRGGIGLAESMATAVIEQNPSKFDCTRCKGRRVTGVNLVSIYSTVDLHKPKRQMKNSGSICAIYLSCYWRKIAHNGGLRGDKGS